MLVFEVGFLFIDSVEIVCEEQMEYDDGFDRDFVEEVQVMFFCGGFLYLQLINLFGCIMC